jgi:dTDP-glucose pyrophosphorylase
MNEKLLIDTKSTIKVALRQLNNSGEKCLVVVGDGEKFIGTLSDGDVRKAILNGQEINSSIQTIFNKNSTYLLKDEYSKKEVKDIFLKNKFDLIPILDKTGKIIEILTWIEIFENGKNRNKIFLNVPVVIMAGGSGTRMEPFTKILPKPLIPIHGEPIIEHIIERFTDIGCFDFHVTVNYKSRILKAYFEELQPNYSLSFIYEKEPLGTAGSLRYLMDKFDKPFFVTNCDIIIKADYASLYEFHQKGRYDVTLVASTKEYIIPYGTCELNGSGYLSHINEKPAYEFLINTGLYILNPDVLSIIPKNKFYHITHMIEDLKNAGKTIGVFPIDDDAWIDIGQWAEYKKAVEQF